MAKKYKQLITTGLFPFAPIIKSVREQKKLTRKEIGAMINRSAQQIQRYETPYTIKIKELHQHPTLHQFKKLCIVLQVDPATLLGLKWIDSDKPDDRTDFIYDWQQVGDKVVWTCPICIKQNITYGDFRRHPKLMKKQIYDCEYSDCGASFNKLYGL